MFVPRWVGSGGEGEFGDGMTDVCVRGCAGAAMDRYPTVNKEELVEKVRERMMYARKRRSEAQGWRPLKV